MGQGRAAMLLSAPARPEAQIGAESRSGPRRRTQGAAPGCPVRRPAYGASATAWPTLAAARLAVAARVPVAPAVGRAWSLISIATRKPAVDGDATSRRSVIAEAGVNVALAAVPKN